MITALQLFPLPIANAPITAEQVAPQLEINIGDFPFVIS